MTKDVGQMSARDWIKGRIPTADEVRANESDHPRPDGIRLGRITISRQDKPTGEYVEADDRSYGEWLCYHRASRLQPYASVQRLKAVGDEVLQEVGFTGWMPLAEMLRATECEYFPVGKDGLPADYLSLLSSGQRAERLEKAATELLDAMETCHICKGALILEESPIHCEDCSGDCENHEEPECTPIYVLHANLRKEIKRLWHFEYQHEADSLADVLRCAKEGDSGHD